MSLILFCSESVFIDQGKNMIQETMVVLVRTTGSLTKAEAVDCASRIAREFAQFDKIRLEEDSPTVFAVFIAQPLEIEAIETKKRKLVAEILYPLSFGVGSDVASAKDDLRRNLPDTGM
jgi:thiazole synthase ThiGH ThiG subunit